MKSGRVRAKILSMEEAVSELIGDGCSIAIGTGLEAAIPFAAGHEIIRQNKKDLTLVGPISDMLFDQMIGAGCVRKVMAAWVGNVIMGVGYNLRRAVEKGIPGRIEIVDYSNFSMALALHAGELGIPFIPTKTLLGTGMMEGNAPFKAMTCPYTGEMLALVPALKPDVAIVYVQRVDGEGNSHFWGGGGVTREAAMAARKIIVVAEELVSKRVIQRDPNRTLFPGFLVSAVVIEPRGAHPSPVQGYYDRDHESYVTYHHESKERNGFLRWLSKWVLEVKDRKGYLSRLGKDRIRSLAVKHHKKSTPVDYGY
jgi:glutaconate CoA-transferase subunit A